MSILVVAAHPDDEALGAGGTIARLADEGESVHVAILGHSRVPSRHVHEAAEHLRSGSLQEGGLPDQRFDTFALREITEMIERTISRIEPSIIYTHHPGDLNLDHQITSRAVLTACRPVNGCPVRTIYAMEVPSSTEWGDGSFHPTTFVDISATLDRKVEAMEMYETERRDWPHPRSPEALRALARYRGSAVGLEAAEAFQLLRHIQP